MTNLISIGIAKRLNIKLEESLLDSYSLKKYKTLYQESKTKVRADIKKLSEINKTTTVKDIKMLMIFELLSPKDKKVLMNIYEKEISKFT